MVLYKLVMCLASGAVINVAVAWACAAWMPFTAKSSFCAKMWWEPKKPKERGVAKPLLSETKERWVVVDDTVGVGFSKWYTHNITYSPYSNTPVRELPTWSRIGEQEVVRLAAGQKRITTRIFEYTAGWPCTALFGATNFRAVYMNGNPVEGARSRIGVIELPPGGLGQRGLPLQPLWPGFAINTMVFALRVLMP